MDHRVDSRWAAVPLSKRLLAGASGHENGIGTCRGGDRRVGSERHLTTGHRDRRQRDLPFLPPTPLPDTRSYLDALSYLLQVQPRAGRRRRSAVAAREARGLPTAVGLCRRANVTPILG